MRNNIVSPMVWNAIRKQTNKEPKIVMQRDNYGSRTFKVLFLDGTDEWITLHPYDKHPTRSHKGNI